MTERLSFGPVRTSAANPERTSPLRLSRRGERVAAVLIGVALIGATWLASAVGFWLTGAAG